LWFVLLPLTVVLNATNRRPGRLGKPPRQLRASRYRNVAFRTSDGVLLSAWYIAPRNGAAVVPLPGAGSTRIAMLGQAPALARHGYGALLTDTRGHGRSGGNAMDFGWWGDRDIAAALSLPGTPARRPGRQDRRAGPVDGQRAAGVVPRYRGTMRYSSMRNHDPSPTAILLRHVMTPGSQASQVNRTRAVPRPIPVIAGVPGPIPPSRMVPSR
jgi:hypothetical protein